MGHPPGAVWLPLDAPALGEAVERIRFAHGCHPAELAALLSGRGRAGQLTAIAWVLDPAAGRILLVHHPVLGWACPGGHVEQGEDPSRAAARELFEETGFHAVPDAPDPVTLSRVDMPADRNGPAHVHWNLGYRFTADPDGALRAEAGRPAQWWPVDGLPPDVPADLPGLLAVLAH